MIELIKIENIICALIIRYEFQSEGIQFFTEPEDTFQLGYMKRQIGYSIAPHIHIPVARRVEFTNEVLLIKKGKVRVNFYDVNFKFSSKSSDLLIFRSVK